VEERETTGVAWKILLRIDPPLAAIQKGKITLGLDVGIAPSGGGSLEGTSTDSSVRLYLAKNPIRSPWTWDVGIRYTRRQSSLEGVPTYQTAGLGGGVQYALSNLLSLRLSASATRQLDANDDVTSAEFRFARLGLVVYPKGRARSGR
jgi:hypothetical protein